MKVVIQRVLSAQVSIAGEVFSSIGPGMLILLGVAQEDTPEDLEYLLQKVSALRIFDDENGVMNLSLGSVGGQVLVVSQFTLLASTRKGNRPSYLAAAHPDKSFPMYLEFCDRLGEVLGVKVETGKFGADMQVSLINDGPVTILIDSKQR